MGPDDYAASYAVSLDLYQASLPRSLQTELGISSIGHCASEALWRVKGIPESNAPAARQALHGTAIHRLHAAARSAYNPRLLVDRRLVVTLPSGLQVPGSPDEIDPDEPSVTDLKSVNDAADMAALRRTGGTTQQRYQKHLYYLAAHQAGLVPAEGIVRNVWVDRSGETEIPFVEQEPFSMEVVHEADVWIGNVLYAAEHGEEALREKPYDWCMTYCPFAIHCRSGQAHADFTLTDGEMVQAARLLRDGRDQRKEGELLEEAAKRVLAPLQQSAEGDVAAFVTVGPDGPENRVRWQFVNAKAGGYWKVSVAAVELVAAG